MIDVMMFLLVFFVLISINVIPALGLKMKLPASTQARPEIPKQRVVVGMQADGGLELDGTQVPDIAALNAALLQRQQAASGGVAVLIKGDDAVPLQRLVDLMDVLKSIGIDTLTIATKRK